MKKLNQYRNNESLCRQRAAFDHEHSWHWLAEAEMWANKAQDEISAQFHDYTAARDSEIPVIAV